MTAAMTFFTQGSDSEVVRLSAKAFRNHITLLGHLLGLNSIASPSQASTFLSPAMSRSPSASCGSFSPSKLRRSTSSSSSSFASFPSSSKMSRSSSYSYYSPGPSPSVSRSTSFSSVRAWGGNDDAAGVGIGGSVGAVSRAGPSFILQQLALAMTLVLLLVAVAAAMIFGAGAAPINGL